MIGRMPEHKNPCNDSGISSKVPCKESSSYLGVKRLFLSWRCCNNRPRGATASSHWRRNSCECTQLFITSCARLNSRFSALWSWIFWMGPQGAKQWNFSTPHSQYYSTPECRAFQTISEEKWKARRRVIYRVLLASALALALTASNDISHLPSKRGLWCCWEEEREFLSECLNGCNLNFCRYLGGVEWEQLQPSDPQTLFLSVSIFAFQCRYSHFMLSKWPVAVTRCYCFINRAQTTPALLEMQRAISSLD